MYQKPLAFLGYGIALVGLCFFLDLGLRAGWLIAVLAVLTAALAGFALAKGRNDPHFVRYVAFSAATVLALAAGLYGWQRYDPIFPSILYGIAWVVAVCLIGWGLLGLNAARKNHSKS